MVPVLLCCNLLIGLFQRITPRNTISVGLPINTGTGLS